LGAGAEIGGVACGYEVTAEVEDFACLAAGLVAVVQDQGVNAGVHAEQLEVQVGDLLRSEGQ